MVFRAFILLPSHGALQASSLTFLYLLVNDTQLIPNTTANITNMTNKETISGNTNTNRFAKSFSFFITPIFRFFGYQLVKLIALFTPPKNVQIQDQTNKSRRKCKIKSRKSKIKSHLSRRQPCLPTTVDYRGGCGTIMPKCVASIRISRPCRPFPIIVAAEKPGTGHSLTFFPLCTLCIWQ